MSKITPFLGKIWDFTKLLSIWNYLEYEINLFIKSNYFFLYPKISFKATPQKIEFNALDFFFKFKNETRNNRFKFIHRKIIKWDDTNKFFKDFTTEKYIWYSTSLCTSHSFE